MRLFPVPDNNFGIIARKQRVEAERFARIFDPKMRIKGVDIEAVVEQIQEKTVKKIELKEADNAYARASNEMNQFMNQLDLSLTQMKTINLYQLNEDRKQQYRDDPLLPRIPIDEQTPHVSGLKSFIGDDLEISVRVKRQQEQMRVWAHEQVFEREQLKKQARQQDIQCKEYQNALNGAMDEIDARVKQLKKDGLRRDYEFNTALSGLQKKQAKAEKAALNTFDSDLLRRSRMGDLMYETPMGQKTNGSALVYEYKGMTRDEIVSIRRAQDQQRAEKEQAALDIKAEERAYHMYQEEMLAFHNQLDEKKREIIRMQNGLQSQLNDVLVQDKKSNEQKYKESRQVYEPQSFFASFNKSTR